MQSFDDRVVEAITAYTMAGVSPEETCEDLGLILAWRFWNSSEGDVAICSPIFEGHWFPKQPFVGRCLGKSLYQMLQRHDNRLKTRCFCGVYALKEKRALFPHDLDFDWHGPVALWGDVVEHEYGYRASIAYPLGLETVWRLSRPNAFFLDLKNQSRVKLAPALSQAYGIPVADGVTRKCLEITEDHPQVAQFADLMKLIGRENER